jgi:SAM-dependent MidA family methyltransferase
VAPGAAPEGGTGFVVAVEFFDALPVHRLRRRAGSLVELRVGLDDSGRLVEVEGDPDAAAAAWAERFGAARDDEREAEVCPALDVEVERMARLLDRGIFLVVDYGHESAELYAERRARGTLLAYTRHRTCEDYLDRVGEQDLTAHVNFTALRAAGEAAGLTWLGATTQDRFLIANGILEVFEAEDAAAWRDPGRVRDRTRAMRLIHPDGMGRAFRVALLAKGLAGEPALRGLEDPFRR